MINVNLISKKSRAYKGRNWTKIVVYGLFGLFSLYFIGVSIYVVISMMVIKNNIEKTNKESVSISNQMLGNNEKLSRFVLTKLILTKIADINKERFPYIDYLDEVNALLPAGSSLTKVDFAMKGWISISIMSQNVNMFNNLENVLIKTTDWSKNKYFTGVHIEGISRDKTGTYTTTMQFELKKNG